MKVTQMNNCIVVLFWIASRHNLFWNSEEISLISSTQRCSTFSTFLFYMLGLAMQGLLWSEICLFGLFKRRCKSFGFRFILCTDPPLSKNRRRGPFSDFYWGEGESVHRLLLIQILKPFVSLKFFLYDEIWILNFISSFLTVLGCLSLTWEIRKLWLENPMVHAIPFEEIQNFRRCHFATLF